MWEAREAPPNGALPFSAPWGAVMGLVRWRVRLGFVVGVVGFVLARPTWRSVAAGAVLAGLGEAVRLWAAGHLDKGRTLARSGPYRWVRHPLYLGSALLGAGFGVATARPVVALLTAGYLGVMLTLTIRAEDAWLRARFGSEYEAYRAGRLPPAACRFSLQRVRANREARTLLGVLAVLALLALKAALRA